MENTEKKTTLHIVPHTHWDREWYYSFEKFRYRLVKLVDTLIDCMEKDIIRFFVFDGQTIALDDYLAIRPENRERIAALIDGGRLLIGPWYTQPNTFMSGAEAQVRNLLRGKKAMEEYGGGMKRINYMPDMFGFNSQIPQMMSGFGMTHLIGARGMPKGCDTYLKWEGADKTAVKVCALPNTYINACAISDRTEPKIFETLGQQITMPSLPDRLEPLLKERERSIAPHILALNGVDHMFPNTSMPETIAKIKELHPEIEAKQSNFEIYIDELESSLEREPTTISGELRDPTEICILPASQSMRMDIKKYNRRMEDFLARHIEPLLSAMDSIGEEIPFALAMMNKAWAYMLENQAHDSLCCSNSETSYREIYNRFEKADDISKEIYNETIQRFIRRIDNLPQEAVLIMNPSTENRGESVTIDVIVPKNRNFAEPHLFFCGDEIKAYTQGAKTDSLLRFVPFSGLVGQLSVDIFKMTFETGELPAMGYKLFEVRGGGPQDRPVKGIVIGLRELENEYLSVSVNADATLDIADKRNNRIYKGAHSFIDDGETGNGFEHASPLQDKIAVSGGRGLNIEIIENNPAVGAIRVSQSMLVPKKYSGDSFSRSAEQTEINISTDLILRKGCPYVEFRTCIDNTANDHRLRVAFPTDIENETAFAGQPFDVVNRPVQPESIDCYDTWYHEPYVGYHPMHDFCGISDGKEGVTVAGDGIMEYEVLSMRKSVCLTLLRCTDKIYGGVLGTGSEFNLPAAQMPGKNEFRYAFIPHRGDYINSLKSVERFRHPLSSAQKDFLENETMPGYIAPKADLPHAGGLIKTEGNIVVTALKPAEDGNGSIFRFYNPTQQSQKIKITVDGGFDILSCGFANLDESAGEPLAFSSNTIFLTAEPKKIISLRMNLRRN